MTISFRRGLGLLNTGFAIPFRGPAPASSKEELSYLVHEDLAHLNGSNIVRDEEDTDESYKNRVNLFDALQSIAKAR